MKYRKLPHGDEQISVIGLGGSSIHSDGKEEMVQTIREAFAQGINYFDMAVSESVSFAAYGEALKEHRKQVYYQIHFGANYRANAAYSWTTDLEQIKRSIDWQLNTLQTDYIDFGFIHCIDEASDLRQVEKSGVIRHIEDLKRQGVVSHIGLSSHTPALAAQVVDMGILDMLMFSINPAYDYSKGTYGIGNVSERMALYQKCEAAGVGISVMKPFCGGQLLSAQTSPFGRALTENQCIQYALDTPGVLTVLPGVRNIADLRRVLAFLDAKPEETDYSVIGSFAPQETKGVCVYCNHCQPCPMGLDVGLINKYYDLAQAGDALARNHYQSLEKKATACVQCGHCNRRCPFQVDQISRMKAIAEYFGE